MLKKMRPTDSVEGSDFNKGRREVTLERSLEPPGILSVVSDAIQRLLVSESLIIQRIGVKDAPISIEGQQLEKPQDKEKDFLSQHDKGQELNDLVKEFVDAATVASVALHKEIEAVPQNRPFGGNVACERLMIENLKLVTEILEFDDATTTHI